MPKSASIRVAQVQVVASNVIQSIDGVEVQEISGIASDDIVKVDVIKDPAITKIFSPRLGGVVLITTKSKKFLSPILEDFNKRIEEQRQQRIPGEFRIR